MSNIHLFNPENDLALAVNSPYYTPRATAEALKKAGELLPMWWADDDDVILVSDVVRHFDEYKHLQNVYGLKGQLVTHLEPKSSKSYKPECWGWSSYARRQFTTHGVDPSVLPDDSTLERIRTLSHRRTSIAIHKHINTSTALIPIETSDLDEAFDTIDRHGGKAVVKLPWSSSSRGILYSDEIPRDTLRVYLQGIIHRHGSLLIEPRFNKLMDFAALFLCNDGHADFKGWSMFTADSKSRYQGNLIMPQQRMLQLIGHEAENTLIPITDALNHIIAPYYSGWLGVDMLWYQSESGEKQIAPCIEVNLRRTMGVAALEIHQRLPELMRNDVRLLTTSSEGISINPAN